MEDTMKETLKNILYTGIGIAFLTKEKVEELKADLIEKGKMSQEEGRLFVDDLLRRSEKARDQLDLWINKRVEERIAQFDLATRDELADLRRQVEELQVALNRESGE
jgi:polyhydroxyalkanoate synthesis regulator phasin